MPAIYPGTDPRKPLHRALMAPLILERLPGWAVLFLLVGLGGGVGLAWSTRAAEWIGIAWLLFAMLDWGLLAWLPTTERSYGPVRPALLALTLVRLSVSLLVAPTGAAWLVLAAMAAISLVTWYSCWIEPFSIRITHQTRAFPQWPVGAAPLRLLHLSDLHLERAGLREARLNRLIKTLAPDLICFTGDLLSLSYNRDRRAIEDARQVLDGWRAPLGVYVVTGSPLVDLPETAAAILADLPAVRWLQDQAATIEHQGCQLSLVGLSCSHIPPLDDPKLRSALVEVPAGRPTVLLYHTPDLGPEAAAAGIDLQLSGHTHGGQVRLPLYGALITSSIYGKRFEMGRYDLTRGGRPPMTLYVSRGIGVEGGAAPRARLLCPPEIALWTLTGPPAAGEDRT